MRNTRERDGGFHSGADRRRAPLDRLSGATLAGTASRYPGQTTGSRLYPRPVQPIEEHSADIDGLPVFWRSAPSGREAAPALYLHGVPTSSTDWLPFLERTGGLAPDLPGFGRSGKPGYLTHTIEEYASFLERFLDLLEVPRVRMLVHDWGVVGLAFAQAHPERVERLVVTNAVPLLPGYRWHRTARMWRTPVIGELTMGATSRWAMRRSTARASATPGALPEEWIDSVMAHFDQGTQRAILRLYRSSPSEVLARAGEHLSRLQMPTLVLWGICDPYIPTSFAADYAKALPNSELVELQDAGHWWWLDRPDAIERACEFISADTPPVAR